MLRSSIGRKALMAVTGLGLVGYVIVHMIGNLKVYQGPEALNAYAHTLKSMTALLWSARLGLLMIFVAHLYLGVKLYAENRAARPIEYVRHEPRTTTLSSRTMLLSGMVILAFVIYHLLHFTIGVIQPDHFPRPDSADPAHRPDVYKMVIKGFQNPAVALSYVVAQIFLGLHLYHAVPSLFQTLGLKHPRYNPLIEKLGLVVALVVVIGNVSMPVSIALGLVGDSIQ